MDLNNFKFTALSLIGLSLISFGCSQPDKQITIETAAVEIMTKAKYCALITVDENGQPHARTMDPFLPNENFVVWLATNPKSRKVTHIKNNPKVALYYFEPSLPGYVTINGVAELVSDKNEKNLHWKDEWDEFYPDQDSSYLLIKIDPVRMEVVNYKYNIVGDTITWAAPSVLIKN